MGKIILVLAIAALAVNCGKSKTNQSFRANGTPISETFYTQSVGDKTKQPVIFIHDGPAGNSASFEYTTAQPLMKLGYYVSYFDLRGQGRSKTANAANYSLAKYSKDLREFIKSKSLKNPILIGHGYGGIVAMRFDDDNANTAKAIVLVDTPLKYWTSMLAIQTNCDTVYKEIGNTAKRDDLDKAFEDLKAKSKPAAQLATAVAKIFDHANNGCKILTTKKPTDEELALRKKISNIPAEKTSIYNLMKNSNFVYEDSNDLLNQVKNSKDRYFAIYGNDDGMFSQDEMTQIKAAFTPSQFKTIGAAAHSPFIEQQEEFLKDFQGFMTKFQ